MSLEIGDVLGRFKIAKNIGSGGMCDVFLALDGGNFKYVALKVLNEGRVQEPEKVVQRFIKEAELSSTLSHPNIVTYIDSGDDDGIHYIAYEFITGLSLAELIEKRGALDLDLALSIIQDVSTALLAAHQKGIIHCDIKPHNIMITEDNTIKLIDFGVAALAVGETAGKTTGGLDIEEDDDQEGTVVGTRLYAAPEQNQGKMVDTSSDIYSLGLVFYEMLTGFRLLKAGPLPAIIIQQIKLDKTLPKVHEINPNVPPVLHDIISKMVVSRPDARYKSAVELVADLDRRLPKPELGDADKLWKSKDLAQLELSETYFWTAVNSASDGRYLDSLIQVDRLLRLRKSVVDKYREQILHELIFTFWRLHCAFRGWMGRERAIDVDSYLMLLERLGSLFQRMGADSFIPLVEKRISLVMRDCPDDEARLKYFRSFFANCGFLEKSVPLFADYLETCRRGNLVGEMNGITGFLAANLARAGLYSMASYMYGEALEAAPGNPILEEGRKKTDETVKRFEQARRNFDKLFGAMAAKGDYSAAVNLCRRHLDEHEHDTEVMEKLAGLLSEIRGKAAREAKKDLFNLWLNLARDYFLQEAMSRSKRCIIKALKCKSDSEPALGYLFELLVWEGQEFKNNSAFREIVSTCFLAAGLYHLAIRELERSLRGTTADLAVYGRIFRLADEKGVKIPRDEYYFKMGVCAIKGDKVEEARRFFLEALELSDDPKSIVLKFKQVPGIGKVFTRREILEKLQSLSKTRR